MANPSLSELEQTEANRIREALRPRLELLLQEAADLLASKANTHPFGPTEFALRDLVHAAAADMLAAALREKKTATQELP
jgi:hypothetical protein